MWRVNSGNPQIDCLVQLAHKIAELLDHLLPQSHQFAQFQQREFRQFGYRRRKKVVNSATECLPDYADVACC
jgi:hypothetical protein